MIGIALHESGPSATLEWIRRADESGVAAVWLTSGSAEQMCLLSVAAVQTKTIRLGTSVVPTWLRHPLVLAQQAAVVAELAPGRFVLGIGPSHKPMMEGVFGVEFRRPLTQTREYLEVLRQGFTAGRVDFDGEFLHVHAPSVPRAEAPLMISALREASFKLAGERADGAIAWICPAPYLRSKARKALEAGAQIAGRPAPPLIAHTFLCVSTDTSAVRDDARKRLAIYPRLPFYARMLAEAGDEEAAAGKVSDRMIDSVVIHGSEDECVEKLRRFKRDAAAEEVIASLMVAGADRAAGLEAGMRVVARARTVP